MEWLCRIVKHSALVCIAVPSEHPSTPVSASLQSFTDLWFKRRAEILEVYMFYDRREAGRLLAERLETYRGRNLLVLGLPRGGVPVAYEVATALGAPLDVLVTRKIGAPAQPELAIGSIAPRDVFFLNAPIVRRLQIDDETIQQLVRQETREVNRRTLHYRGEEGVPDVEGKFVLLVDDGIATGLTLMAAVRALREAGVRRIALAVPVSSQEAAEMLEELVDDFICLDTPEDFLAVGSWYRHFEPVSDDEVVAFLQKARAKATG